MKKCNSCDTDKHESEFGKRKASVDGLSAKCKTCQNVYDKARSNCPERAAARAIYQQTEEGRLTTNKAKAKWRTANPGKAKAHAVVGRQVRAGNLFVEPCEICGSEDSVHAHHNDYAKPLNVRWLCAAHHRQWHCANGEGING